MGESQPAPVHPPASLFLVRIWHIEATDGEPTWGGRVLHVTSGRACNLTHLPALGDLLLEMLGEVQGANAPDVRTMPKGDDVE